MFIISWFLLTDLNVDNIVLVPVALNDNVFAKLQAHLSKLPERTKHSPRISDPITHVNFFRQCSYKMSVWLLDNAFSNLKSRMHLLAYDLFHSLCGRKPSPPMEASLT